MDKTGKILSKIITYLLVVLLCLGVGGVVVTLINSLTADNGFYIEYGGNQYFSSSDGITITDDSCTYADFTLGNIEDVDGLVLSDYTVRISPYNTDKYDFSYNVADTYQLTFSSTTDLTGAFVKNYSLYDGGGISVMEDGGFSLYVNEYCYYKDGVLSLVYLSWCNWINVEYDSVDYFYTFDPITDIPNLCGDYCIAICVYSADGECVLEVPVKFDSLKYDSDNVFYDTTDDSSSDISSDDSSVIDHYEEDAEGEGTSVYWPINKYIVYDGSNDYSLDYDGPSRVLAEYTVSFSLSVTTVSGLINITDVVVYDNSGNEITVTANSDGTYEFVMPYSEVYMYIYLSDAETEEEGDNEELDTSISYELYNVTAACVLPSSIEEITGDEITLTFAVNDGYHIADSFGSSSENYVTVTSPNGIMVGDVYVSDNRRGWHTFNGTSYYDGVGFSFEVVDDYVSITIIKDDLIDGLTITIGAEKTHYIYLDMTGCHLGDYYSVDGDLILYDYGYSYRDPPYIEYYYSYTYSDILFCNDDGYYYWYEDEEDEGIYSDFSYSVTSTGDTSDIYYGYSGFGTKTGIYFSISHSVNYNDPYDTADWSLTIYLTLPLEQVDAE